MHVYDKLVVWWATSDIYTKGRGTYVDIMQHEYDLRKDELILNKQDKITKSSIKSSWRGKLSGETWGYDGGKQWISAQETMIRSIFEKKARY